MHAVITGGSRRLGLYIVDKLLAGGWFVSVLTRYASKELSALSGEQLQILEVDYLDQASVTTACSTLAEKKIDLLFHNASYFEKNKKTPTDSLMQLEHMTGVHVALPALLNERLYPAMTESENANIIHMTDIYVNNPHPDYANYCATKAALENLSMSFAKRYAPEVRVNTIQPGALMFLPDHTESAKASVIKQSLIQTEAGFEPVWLALAALLENPFITGTAIKVDGGRSICR